MVRTSNHPGSVLRIAEHPDAAQRTSADSVTAVRALARAARLLERSCGEISLAHYRILSAVAAGEQRASRLAMKFALGKPAVSSAVDVLFRRGLLVRLGDEDDQRATSLELTAEGREVLARTEAAMVALLDDLQARLGDRRGAVTRALCDLGAAIEQRHSERFPADVEPAR